LKCKVAVKKAVVVFYAYLKLIERIMLPHF
jgi:hypothetical protein